MRRTQSIINLIIECMNYNTVCKEAPSTPGVPNKLKKRAGDVKGGNKTDIQICN